MEINICKEDKFFPFLLVDNWFSPEEEELVWKELDYYTCYETMYNSGEKGDAASDDDGKSLSDSYRMYPDHMYNGESRRISHILRFQQPKIFSKEIVAAMLETTSAARLWENCTQDNTIINYYENDNQYKKHCDTSFVSAIIWLYRSPKLYTGGEFTFVDSGITIEDKHNRLVMFPGFYEHEVAPVFMTENKLGWGKYSIVHLYNSR